MNQHLPSIMGRKSLSQPRLRYWRSLSLRLFRLACEGRGIRVDVIDPDRHTLRELRETYPAGTRVYRASTGGRWGKSSAIVTL